LGEEKQKIENKNHVFYWMEVKILSGLQESMSKSDFLRRYNIEKKSLRNQKKTQ